DRRDAAFVGLLPESGSSSHSQPERAETGIAEREEDRKIGKRLVVLVRYLHLDLPGAASAHAELRSGGNGPAQFVHDPNVHVLRRSRVLSPYLARKRVH